jgi:hypothetical protein
MNSRRRIGHPLKLLCGAAYRGQGHMGTGCIFAGGPTSYDLFCSAGGGFWPVAEMPAGGRGGRFLGTAVAAMPFVRRAAGRRNLAGNALHPDAIARPRKAARSPSGLSAAEQPACGLDRTSRAPWHLSLLTPATWDTAQLVLSITAAYHHSTASVVGITPARA